MPTSATETVQAIYEAFARRDVPRIFALFSREVEIVQSRELPWGGHYRGHAGARQFLTTLTTHLNSTIEIEHLVRAGDVVVAIGWTTGTVNATGTSYRVPIAHVWTIREGLVAHVHFCIDNPMMLEALAAKGGAGP
jgi:ketosteroid isomerase-like protein